MHILKGGGGVVENLKQLSLNIKEVKLNKKK